MLLSARLLLALLITAGCWLPLATLSVPIQGYAETAIVDDAIIVLDVTGSMKGEGPDARARNIWDPTLKAVLDMVDRFSPQTYLGIVPFSLGPDWKLVYPGPIASGGRLTPRQMATNADRDAAKTHLRNLPVEGEATWIYESLEYGLGQLKVWREADSGRQHRQSLLLYTDGIDNGPHASLGFEGILKMFRASKADFPYLYIVYNDLTNNLTPEQNQQLQNEGVTVTKGAPAGNIESMTDSLDFGDLSASPSGVTRDISFRSGFSNVMGRSAKVRIEPVGGQPGQPKPTLPVALMSDQVVMAEKVPIGIRATGPMPPGQQKAHLVVEPTDPGVNIIPRNYVDLNFGSLAGSLPGAGGQTQPGGQTVSGGSAQAGQDTAVAAATQTALALAGTTMATPIGVGPRGQADATGTPVPSADSSPLSSIMAATIISGIPDAVLLLDVLVVVIVGAVIAMWRLEFGLFEPRPPQRQLLWKLDGVPMRRDEAGVQQKILKPAKARAAQEWIIGTGGDVILLGDATVMSRHAKITYGGAKDPVFRLFAANGAVLVDGTPIGRNGSRLSDDSTFAVGSFFLRFRESATD